MPQLKSGCVTILASLSLLFTDGALGQANFGFRNYDPAYGIDAPVFDAQGRLLVGSDYRAELWGAANRDSLAPLLVLNEDYRREILPFNDRGHIISGKAFLSVLSVPPRGWAWLQMRAWNARLGETYEEVAALGLGGYGESPLFYAQGGNPYDLLSPIPAPLVGLQSFNLRPVVPEPSAVCLLLLGLPLLLWRYHRPK